MTAPTRDLQYLDGEIAAAWSALQSVRAAATRSPNRDTLAAEDRCQERLDWLLDKRPEARASS